MDVYAAIKQMRSLSSAGKSFQFSFMSYSEDRGTSHGIVEVAHALLRKQSTLEQNANADMMLNFVDVDTNDCKMCYQILLMEFNGCKLELN